MIKEQQPNNSPNQTWTFNDNGRTFYVKKNKNLFKFKVHNIFNGQWHQSQDVQLQRINEQTIKAAFDVKIPSVTYQLTQTSQHNINLQFRVVIDYLSTQFTENIELKKVQVGKQESKMLQFTQLYNQVKKIQQMIKDQQNISDRQLYLQKGNCTSRQGPIFMINLKPGKYYFSMSGYYINQQIYNGECIEQYYDDGLGNVMDPQMVAHNKNYTLTVLVDGQMKQKLHSLTPNFLYSYEYPFNISGTVELINEGEVAFSISAYQDNSVNFKMNNYLLTILPLNIHI